MSTDSRSRASAMLTGGRIAREGRSPLARGGFRAAEYLLVDNLIGGKPERSSAMESIEASKPLPENIYRGHRLLVCHRNSKLP